MRAIYSVTINGQDISSALNPVLTSLTVTDNTGSSSDTASLEIDDKDGRIVMPAPGDRVVIMLGWEGQGLAKVFEGTTDAPNAKGGRGGRTLSINAKGMDTRGKIKQAQRRHFDDTTIQDALNEAGKFAGITVDVDPAFASITRPYIALDDESFVAFGERIARELGGTFKIQGDRAIVAKRNGGLNTAGAALPSVAAAWGSNLHNYDITPNRARRVEKETATAWYNAAAATWAEELAETGTEGGTTRKTSRFSQADKQRASEQSGSDASESDRRTGGGSVTIEGNTSAQPEGTCTISNCRGGIDGTYRIESVTHSYSRSGFITSLELRQPKGAAGKDTRGSPSGTTGDEDFALPAHPTLG